MKGEDASELFLSKRRQTIIPFSFLAVSEDQFVGLLGEGERFHPGVENVPRPLRSGGGRDVSKIWNWKKCRESWRPESIEWFIESQASSRSYDLVPSSSPPALYPVSKLDRRVGDTQEDWEREATCWRERGGRGGRGAESYDRKKAWSFPIIRYSLLEILLSKILLALLWLRMEIIFVKYIKFWGTVLALVSSVDILLFFCLVHLPWQLCYPPPPPHRHGASLSRS